MKVTLNRHSIYLLGLGGAILLLFAANLLAGSVSIPPAEVLRILCGEEGSRASWRFIVIESRLPQAVTALLCGSALATCGLMLQTAFKNPLAGPSILGINSGASLGVALVMLLWGGSLSAGVVNLTGFLSILAGAFIGSAAVMGVLLFFSTLIRSNVLLLIVGIMIGYVTSSAISLLNFFATAEGIQSYLIWGMGSFGGVSLAQLPAFSSVTLAGMAGALLLIKPLDALLLGERYAANLGIHVGRVRQMLLGVTGLLTAVTTAFCGPVSFIGLAVPHVARLLLGTANHHHLLPATLLCGGTTALLCNLLCMLPGEGGIIPLNAVTPLVGAPVIIYVIVSRNRSNGLD